jgi:hypothetical protein
MKGQARSLDAAASRVQFGGALRGATGGQSPPSALVKSIGTIASALASVSWLFRISLDSLDLPRSGRLGASARRRIRSRRGQRM